MTTTHTLQTMSAKGGVDPLASNASWAFCGDKQDSAYSAMFCGNN